MTIICHDYYALLTKYIMIEDYIWKLETIFANHNNASQNSVSQMSTLPHILPHIFSLPHIYIFPPIFYLFLMPHIKKMWGVCRGLINFFGWGQLFVHSNMIIPLLVNLLFENNIEWTFIVVPVYSILQSNLSSLSSWCGHN